MFDDDFIVVEETEWHYTCKNCGHRFHLIAIPKSNQINCPNCGLAYNVDEKGKFAIRLQDEKTWTLLYLGFRP
jgi:DNA-directed RNA polymerase subunit RPC12/RpoP